MKNTFKIIILFLTLNLIYCNGNAQKKNINDKTIEFDFSTIEKFRETKLRGIIISDYDSIFSPSERKELSDIIYNYHIETTRQIVVVTIDNIFPYSDIKKFATDLSNYWGVGDAEKNNGLTIVMCNPCRQITIVTGFGTEKILTDEICKEVIDQTIIPEFKNGNYYDGIKTGVNELIVKWN